MTPTKPAKRNQYMSVKKPRNELPSTRMPAKGLMSLSGYHVVVSAMYSMPPPEMRAMPG